MSDETRFRLTRLYAIKANLASYRRNGREEQVAASRAVLDAMSPECENAIEWSDAPMCVVCVHPQPGHGISQPGADMLDHR